MVALSIVEINAVTHRGRVRAYRDITAARAGQRANVSAACWRLQSACIKSRRRSDVFSCLNFLSCRTSAIGVRASRN
jgi:hypothetical protein